MIQTMNPMTPFLITWGICGFIAGMLFMWMIVHFFKDS